MSYIRNKTRPQGDRPIFHKQKNFGEGLNIDLPASDVNVNANPNLENYIAFERYVDGRSGSVLVQDTLPGSGTVHSMKIHSESGICVMHRGIGVYIVGAVNSEILEFEIGSPLGFGFDNPTRLVEFGKDFLLYLENPGIIFRIVISKATKSFFRINTSEVISVPNLKAPVPNTGQFKYKIAFTFIRIIKDDGTPATTGDRLSNSQTIIHETPPIFPDDAGFPTDTYFTLISLDTAIDPSNTVVYEIGVSVGDPTVTHVAWYRTPDLGQDGKDNIDFAQFVWIGDAIASVSDGDFTDDVIDKTIDWRLENAPNLRLKNVGWTGLPANGLGEVTAGFIFAADPNGDTVYYSQRTPDDTRVGFHNAGNQFHKLDDGMTVFGKSKDTLSMLTKKKSYVSTLTSIIDGGVLQFEAVLSHLDAADEDLGVTDEKSFVKAEDGTYIAICSDKSVRAWDSGGWSRDLAVDRVRKIIERIETGLTVSGFYNGAYFIWFSLDDNDTKPNRCMRFSFKRESGKGWTFYTGIDWVLPPVNTGVMVGSNFMALGDARQEFFFVLNESDNKIYWIETFNGPENLTINSFPLTEYFADKISSGTPNGTDIGCRVRAKDITGSMESFNIKHSESHAYIRDTINLSLPASIPAPPTNAVVYPELFLDALAFVDGVQVSVETAGKVDIDGDIQFWYKVEGSRIGIEFQTNRSGHRLIGLDSRFRVQDINRPNKGPTITVAKTFQQEFQENLQQWWFSRPLPMLDRTLGQKFPLGPTPLQIGPDFRSCAVKVGVANGVVNKFIKPNTTVYSGAFTISFWIGNLTFANGAATIMRFHNASDVVEFTVRASSATRTDILEGTGSVTVDNLNANGINGFHQIILVRTTGSNIRWYQNNLLKGTTTFAGSFGGGKFEAGAPA